MVVSLGFLNHQRRTFLILQNPLRFPSGMGFFWCKMSWILSRWPGRHQCSWHGCVNVVGTLRDLDYESKCDDLTMIWHSGKLTWLAGKSSIFNREYIFIVKRSIFIAMLPTGNHEKAGELVTTWHLVAWWLKAGMLRTWWANFTFHPTWTWPIHQEMRKKHIP